MVDDIAFVSDTAANEITAEEDEVVAMREDAIQDLTLDLPVSLC